MNALRKIFGCKSVSIENSAPNALAPAVTDQDLENLVGVIMEKLKNIPHDVKYENWYGTNQYIIKSDHMPHDIKVCFTVVGNYVVYFGKEQFFIKQNSPVWHKIFNIIEPKIAEQQAAAAYQRMRAMEQLEAFSEQMQRQK
ncbi:MAG: hypothetical protein IJ560_01165 [Alphaproteobacteria bacterium]|nr:hypothetical protein [Alphaproteobacteria bacterium]